jgi:STE24 endopeptidase
VRSSLPRQAAIPVLHGIALAAVVIAAVVNVVRPVAPDLGPPPDPAVWFDPGHLALASQYRAPLYVVAVAGLLLRITVPLLAAFTSAGRRLTERIIARVGVQRPARSATAVVLVIVVATDLVVFPLAFWAGYVHEGVWGFRTQGFSGWLYDWVVAKAPLWLAVAVVTLLGFWLARQLPRAWPPVGGLVAGALAALAVFAAPVVLEPLVFRTHPLPEGDTQAAVEEVVAAAGVGIDQILVADASRRTTRRNAYVSGLGGTRRVVLYDTLIDNHPPEEVAMVLAHEVGHHVHGDLGRGTAAAVGASVFLAYLLAAVAARRARAGLQDGSTDPRGAPVLVVTVVLVAVISAPLQQYASRQAEAAADLAALELTGDPGTFLSMQEGLARSALSGPLPPRWSYVLWSSHPPVAARMGMAEWWGAQR